MNCLNICFFTHTEIGRMRYTRSTRSTKGLNKPIVRAAFESAVKRHLINNAIPEVTETNAEPPIVDAIDIAFAEHFDSFT